MKPDMRTKRIGRAAFVRAACLCACLLLFSAAFAAPPKPLQIYFIDVEGGQSTLVVDPEGESLLIDAGWPDFDGRDANRIVKAAKEAGIDHIDYMVVTHYHMDHVGGVPQLVERMKIDAFVDHGPNREHSSETRTAYADYVKAVGKTTRIAAKPGDQIPFKGMNVQVVTSDGEEIQEPLPGAGQPNPLCQTVPEVPADPSENARSVGLLVTFGKFRFIDLGDLTIRKEIALACPKNVIGTVDLYLITHHGTAHPGSGDSSNAREIVEALHPRVAIMNNGALKGGHPVAWQTVHDSPGLEDLWQLHYSIAGGDEHNSPQQFIANISTTDDGYFIMVAAEPNGTFTVVNSRNNHKKTYKK